MSENSLSSDRLEYFPVWDRTTRWFHWINAICITGLVCVGLVILNNKALGVSSDGKILLKTTHVFIGYTFVLNLIWRFIWAFAGNRYSRWKSILPTGKAYWSSLRAYLAGAKAGKPPLYLGHNPIGRLMLVLLFLLLTTQAVTGLVLAGTDLYFPPFGNQIAEWIAGSGADAEKIANLKPGSKEGVDLQAYEAMREFRAPFITTHVYSFYTLLLAIAFHIAAVVITEIRENNGLISAMFTGKKVLPREPVDLD